MTNLTQIQWVKNRLKLNKKISRNKCLKEFISRLSAIIAILKNQGWEFETKYIKTASKYGWTGKDYVYYLIKKGE